MMLITHIKSKLIITMVSLHLISPVAPTHAQSIIRSTTDTIPAGVESIYKKGLRYLSTSQEASGAWTGSGNRAGIIGLCTLAFLAYGEDPNHGPYALNISRCVDQLIATANQGENGYMGGQMYDHGFATLALAECYGMVDDPRIGPALEKAVALIITAQKANTKKAWRYNPDSKDADSTVSGCQLVALLGARNAGIPVPDKAIDQGLAYMKSCRNAEGAYGYTSSHSPNTTLTAIGSLCYSLAKKQDEAAFSKSTSYLKKNIRDQGQSHPFYFRYYMAQALFQADEELWKQWNIDNTRLLTASQLADGSFASNNGNAYGTAASLLSLALNYRFLPIYEK